MRPTRVWGCCTDRSVECRVVAALRYEHSHVPPLPADTCQLHSHPPLLRLVGARPPLGETSFSHVSAPATGTLNAADMIDDAAPVTPPPPLASLTDLTTFRLTRLLSSNKDVAHMLGTFPPHPASAILTLRATKLSSELIHHFIDSLSLTHDDNSRPPRLTLRHANDIYYSFVTASSVLPNHIDVIFPATDKHIASLSTQQADVLLLETPQLYSAIHQPYIQQQLAAPTHLTWLYNILAGTSEADRVVGRTDEWVAVAQPEWDMHSLDTLHVIVVPHTRGITSLRALNASHLPLLAAMREGIVHVLSDKCGVSADELLLYLHYPPSFYHLHVHVAHVSVSASLSSQVNKAVDLYEVEQQLQRDGRWYEQCTIRCRVRGSHPLATMTQHKHSGEMSSVIEQCTERSSLT